MEPVTYLRAAVARRSILTSPVPPEQARDRYWLHGLLFVVTLGCTIFAGGQFAGRMLVYLEADVWFVMLGLPVGVPFILDGLAYGVSLLLFLTVHEFGHYFAARRHGVSTSLPYYIPLPPPLGFGTLGAVIRIREPIPSTRKLFDVGAGGPLAGFVVALGLLLYALVTLPPPGYMLDLGGHEPLKEFIREYGRFPDQLLARPPEEQGTTMVIGETLLFWVLSRFFEHVPPMYEIYHYPMLFAAWLGLFFTALNLLPVGQLDGGHILYTLVGPKWHGRLARGFVMLLLLSGSIGFVSDLVPVLYTSSTLTGDLSWFILAAVLYFFLNRIFSGNMRLIAPILLGLILATALVLRVWPAATQFGYWGWFIWCLLIVFLIRVDHPPVLRPESLTPGRRVLAALSLLLFVLCFSFRPIYLV